SRSSSEPLSVPSASSVAKSSPAKSETRNSGPELLFTENETNSERLFGVKNASPYVKDAFDTYVVHGCREAVNPAREGTKAAAYYRLELDPGQSATVRLRLTDEPLEDARRKTPDARKDEPGTASNPSAGLASGVLHLASS